jgi:hypothetical protein
VTLAGEPLNGDLPSNEWEFSNPGFKGQNAAKKRAIAIDLGAAEIWLGHRLVNGGRDRRFEAFGSGFGTLKPGFTTDQRPRQTGIFGMPDCERKLRRRTSQRSYIKPFGFQDFIILTDFRVAKAA